MIFKELRKNSLFTNLKKCQLYKDKVCFLGYVISAQGVQIENKKMEVLKIWPELKLVRDIQVFLGFANFYHYFIQGFSKLVTSLTSMLRTSPTLIKQLFINIADDEFGEGDYSEDEARILLVFFASKDTTRAGYLTFGVKKTFNFLQPTFI